MKATLSLSLSALVLAITGTVHAKEAPVFVELFTSQGCTACPPADRYMAELAKQKNVIPVSCHVTYWDRLGWKDTNGRPFCNDRQLVYHMAWEEGNPFTPELVVNGSYSTVGSNRANVQDLIAKQSGEAKSISLKKVGAKEYSIKLPNVNKRGETMTVTLFGIESNNSADIKRGELRGKSVAYTNSVKWLQTVSTVWDGKKSTLKVTLDNEETDNLVVVGHDGAGVIGPVLAVGSLN